MAGIQAQNGSQSQFVEDSKSLPAPKFTRQDIIRMQDQFLSFNLERACLTSTGSFAQKQERLLEFYYPANPTNGSGDTPLHNAAQDRSFEELEVNGTTNPTGSTNGSGDTPLHNAAPDRSSVEEEVIGTTNPTRVSGDTPLHLAAQEGSTVEMVHPR